MCVSSPRVARTVANIGLGEKGENCVRLNLLDPSSQQHGYPCKVIGRKNGTQGADGKAVQLRGALDRCLEAFHPSYRFSRSTRLDWRRLFVGRILVEVERSDLPWRLGMDDNPSIDSIGFRPLIENDNVDFKATLYERIRCICCYPLRAAGA